MSVNNLIMDALKDNDVGFVTTVPCKQLAGVIEKIEQSQDMIHVPSNREDEGMGLCAGAFMGGKRPAIISSTQPVDMRPAARPEEPWCALRYTCQKTFRGWSVAFDVRRCHVDVQLIMQEPAGATSS